MVNSSYTYSVFGMAAYTFAIGGLLVWVPNYLFSTRGFDQKQAGMHLGLVTFAAALVGMTVGRLARRPAGEDPAGGPVPRPGRGDARVDPVRAARPVLDVGAGDLRGRSSWPRR